MTSLPTVSKVLAQARTQIGVHETPVNHQKYGAWYGMNDVAWCAIFQSWVFAEVGGLPLIGGKQSYTPTFAGWFQEHAQWGHTPKVGAIVFYAWPGQEFGRISHVGIVEAVNADGSIITIEGNTTASDDPAVQRNGGGVCRVHRTLANVAGFGYPKYAPTVVAKPKQRAVLQKGSKGSDVVFLQKTLNKYGDPQLLVDGEFGPATDARIRAFQKLHHLVVDGVVGPKTWKVLDKFSV